MKKAITLLLCSVLLLSMLGIPIGATQEQPSATDTATTDTTATDTETDTTTQSIQPTTLPQSASYIFVNTALGYASGTLSLQMPEQSNATSFALYWGDASGSRMQGLTPFITGEIIAPTMSVSTTEAFSIPAGAKSMLLYTYNEQSGESTTPYKIDIGTYTLPETGKKLSELVIVSDLHIGSGKTAEKNLITMLTDVKNTSPDAAGIIVVGDAVEAADPAFYEQLEQLCAKVPGAPKLYCGIGDRSYMTPKTYTYDASKHAENLQLFLDHLNHPFGVKPDKPYYSYMLGGALMVFIGADSYQNSCAVYSQEQLAWLDIILKNADAYEPVFLFMHEPLPDTVSGSLGTQGYGNVHNYDDVKQVLKAYDNIVMFNGHTLWQLEADRTMWYLSGGSLAFNTAGVAQLWNDKNGSDFEVAGSQGYYVTVYEDAILVRGRDFITGEWISTATYMFSTKPVPVQTQPPATAAPKPSTSTKPATEQTTEEAEETGIGDLIPPLCILACMAVVVFIFIFRKPKDQA